MWPRISHPLRLNPKHPAAASSRACDPVRSPFPATDVPDRDPVRVLCPKSQSCADARVGQLGAAAAAGAGGLGPGRSSLPGCVAASGIPRRPSEVAVRPRHRARSPQPGP